jgi:hypothetical protein
MEELPTNAAQSVSNHYRDIARKLRELATQYRFPGVCDELLGLALRYERRANDLNARSAAGSDTDRQ